MTICEASLRVSTRSLRWQSVSCRCSPGLPRIGQAAISRVKKSGFAPWPSNTASAPGVSIPVHGSYGSLLMLSLTSAQATNPTLGSAARAEQAVLYIHHRLRAIADSELMNCSLTLSSQEAVCLKWAAKGKYMREISLITNLQYRTVQFYLDNARKKLDATNLVEGRFDRKRQRNYLKKCNMRLNVFTYAIYAAYQRAEPHGLKSRYGIDGAGHCTKGAALH
jgi:DNA-binding CsgD family transcriptional regulator